MLAQSLFITHQAGIPLFVISVFVGLAAALPIGPISMLTLQRAVTLGFWRAFWPTLGAIAAGGLLGFIAALGSGFITSFVLGNSFWFKLAGSGLLLVMGARVLTLRPIDRTVPQKDFGPMQLATLNFTVVLTNPLTLAFFMAAMTFMGLVPGGQILAQSLLVTAGIALGTLVWFLLLCSVAGFFHTRVGDVFLNKARAGVGSLFILIALFSAASVLMAG